MRLSKRLAQVTMMGVLATAVIGTAAIAAPDEQKEQGSKREEMRARVMQKVQTYVSTELTSRLALDPAKSAKLSAAVGEHIKKKQQHRESMKAEMKKLKELVGAGAADAQLRTQLDTVLKTRAADVDPSMLVKEAAAFLTVKEQAKLAVELPDLMRDVAGMVKDARRDMRGERGDEDDDDEDGSKRPMRRR